MSRNRRPRRRGFARTMALTVAACLAMLCVNAVVVLRAGAGLWEFSLASLPVLGLFTLAMLHFPMPIRNSLRKGRPGGS